MQIDIEEPGPVERLLKIEIPTAQVDAQFDQVYSQLAKGARIKGFRPGRVPRGVIERVYREQAEQQVLERLVGETLPAAIGDAELDVVSEPRLEPGDAPSQGAAFSYSARLEIRPEIELKQVKGLEIEKPTLEAPDADPVADHLEQLRQQHAATEEEAEGSAVEDGHLAAIDYEATADGEPFEGGSGKEMIVEIGGGRTIPGFEDELVGMRVGESKEFEIDLPDSYPDEIAGKRAVFRVDLVGLKRRDLPDLDDEFAKDVSDFETLAEFEADLRSRVEKQQEVELERRTREAVLDALIAGNPFPVPPSLVDRQLNNRLARAVEQLRQLPQEQLGPMIESWTQEWRPAAERDVQLGFLLPAIAEAESIEVSDEELEERLVEIAEEEKQTVEVVREAYQQRGYMDALRSSLLEQRVVEFAVAAASVTES